MNSLQAPEIEETLPRPPPCKKEPLDIPLKKAKLFEDKFIMDYQYQVLLAQYQRQNAYHGFRPWTSSIGAPAKLLPHMPFSPLPYLSQEPPILQNPERVVRISECERYEQSYQPNVALAPRNGCKTSPTTSVGIKMDAEHGEYENGERDARDCPIALDVKIKEERPQTPSDESHSPESCITSGANVGNTQNIIDSTPNAPPIR